jgi:glucoamylase
LENVFWQYAQFSKRLQANPARIADAKFLLNGNTFDGPWCNPQADGPALRASSLIRFANVYLQNGGDINRIRSIYNGTQAVIKPDLEYVSQPSNWNTPNSCDLWEERRGLHFFNLMVQRRSLVEGQELANRLGDTGAANWYGSQANAISNRLNAFWDGNVVRTTENGRSLDAAIPLGAIHGNVGDGKFAPQDDRILATLPAFERGFIAEFALNRNTKANTEGLPLAVATGRYYGDLYTGLKDPNTNVIDGAGAWYLSTASVAEVAFRAASAFVKSGSVTVTPINQRLFNAPNPIGLNLNVPVGTYAAGSQQFRDVVAGLAAYGDRHLRRARFHGQPGNRFSEQYNRNNGFEQGVPDLTWSYGSLLTATFARDELASLTSGL